MPHEVARASEKEMVVEHPPNRAQPFEELGLVDVLAACEQR
jgi:hypothetical protein